MILALPNRWLFSFYLQLPVPDEAQLKNMLVLHLEKNDLSVAPDSWSYHDLGKKGNERCIHLFSIPGTRAQARLQLPDQRIDSASPSWEFHDIPQEHLCLVKELGRWGLWYFKDSKCHYSRDLGVATLSAASITLIEQAIWHLQSSGIRADHPQITFLHPVSQEFINALAAKKYSYRDVTLTNPQIPAKRSVLQPEIIRQTKEAARTRGTRQKIIVLTALFVCLIAAAMVGLVVYNNHQVATLKARINEIAPEAEKLQVTEALWNQVDQAAEPNLSPLETLHRVTGTLPKTDLRMTKFQQLDRTVVISGESKEHRQVFEWVKRLKESPVCSHMEWSDPNIKMLPGNLVQFTLQGTIRYAPAE